MYRARSSPARWQYLSCRSATVDTLVLLRASGVGHDVGAAETSLKPGKVEEVDVKVAVAIDMVAVRGECLNTGAGRAVRNPTGIVTVHVAIGVKVATGKRNRVRDVEKSTTEQLRLEDDIAVPEEVHAQDAVENAAFRGRKVDHDERRAGEVQRAA